jgi:hypothetical protein
LLLKIEVSGAFLLKTAKCGAFCKTCPISSSEPKVRGIEQANIKAALGQRKS